MLHKIYLEFQVQFKNFILYFQEIYYYVTVIFDNAAINETETIKMLELHATTFVQKLLGMGTHFWSSPYITRIPESFSCTFWLPLL